MAERPVRAAFPELRHAEAAALNATLIDRALPADQARVASVVRSPLDSGWYRTEVLEVQSDSGEVAKVFLKDFGSVDKGKSRMEDRRERERYFYGRVFPDGSLGLPRYIGEIWGPDRFWLLLEYIDAVPLKWCELDVWFQAAAWLGRFQTMTARKLEELDASGRFTKHGPEYFENASIRAVKGSARFGADVVSTVERAVPVYLEYAAGLMRPPR
ncbi:MAG TPA: hypothetical protein VNP73_06715, partial [Actinomycetota bacterium]|nr:hypothetical protein [Actinomycetota bacterium]